MTDLIGRTEDSSVSSLLWNNKEYFKPSLKADLERCSVSVVLLRPSASFSVQNTRPITRRRHEVLSLIFLCVFLSKLLHQNYL